jgi:hypothetical protein
MISCTMALCLKLYAFVNPFSSAVPSISAQCSMILSSCNRKQRYPLVVTVSPVGFIPRHMPVCFMCMDILIMHLPASATCSSMIVSGINELWVIVIHCFSPSALPGKMAGMEWSVNAGWRNSFRREVLPLFQIMSI